MSDAGLSQPGNGAQRPRWRGYAQLLLIVLALAAAVYFARAPNRTNTVVLPEQAEEGPMEVAVVRPAVTAAELPVSLTGTVVAQVRVSVRAETSGRVVWVSPHFQAGGTLAAGDALVRIDPRDATLRVQAAAAGVRAAEAMLRLQEERAGVARRLFGDGDPHQDGFDWVGREEAVAAAEARVEQARTVLEQAQRELDKTTISLPFTSRVISAGVEVGQLVGPLHPLLGLVYQDGALEVGARIHPRDLALLQPAIGREARVEIEGTVHRATVTSVSAVVDPDSRMATLHLELQDGDAGERPLPGMFAEVSVAGPRRENVYRLPHEVRQDGDSVWIVDAGTLRSMRPHVVGDTETAWVVKAFDTGSGVVVGAPPRAREGLPVAATAAGEF
jgi:RND family efflux transporter MFP subunit